MPGLNRGGKKAAPTRAQASARIGKIWFKPTELLALHGSHLERWFACGRCRRRSAATGAYLHTADGNKMAESRCAPEQFRL